MKAIIKEMNMTNLKSFSVEELSILEALNIKGGATETPGDQYSCSNNRAGCNCSIETPIKHA